MAGSEPELHGALHPYIPHLSLASSGLYTPGIHSCLRNYLLITCQDVFFADGALKHVQPKSEKRR